MSRLKPNKWLTFVCSLKGCNNEQTQLKNQYKKNKYHYCCRKCSQKGQNPKNVDPTTATIDIKKKVKDDIDTYFKKFIENHSSLSCH